MKFLFMLSLIMFSQLSFADESEMVCEIRPPKNIEDLAKEISEQGCKKGDLLLIRDMKITARYKRTAAHACDLERPFTDSDIGVFICHYLGFVRQPRNPDY
tara:strand:- start:125 stop:427 length:303 start_codon:yes stop_codon:yes gene_type:complete